MKLIIATVLAAGSLATAAFAEGDAAAGEKGFKKCKSCHSIEGVVKGGKTGPDLKGLPGRVAGSADFKYGDSTVQAGEKGLVWDEASFVKYLEDPKAFLVDYLGDGAARSKMSFRLKSGGEDIWAYLVSVSQ